MAPACRPGRRCQCAPPQPGLPAPSALRHRAQLLVRRARSHWAGRASPPAARRQFRDAAENRTRTRPPRLRLVPPARATDSPNQSPQDPAAALSAIERQSTPHSSNWGVLAQSSSTRLVSAPRRRGARARSPRARILRPAVRPRLTERLEQRAIIPERAVLAALEAAADRVADAAIIGQ